MGPIASNSLSAFRDNYLNRRQHRPVRSRLSAVLSCDPRHDFFWANGNRLIGPQRALDPGLDRGLVIGLNAVIVAFDGQSPRVLVVDNNSVGAGDDGAASSLPFGPFDPLQHRTLESGLRSWVEAQTGLELDYVEQLYTFGDRDRDPREGRGGPRVISIGYLALVRDAVRGSSDRAAKQDIWQSWYSFFPWEDWREGKPDLLITMIEPHLDEWAAGASSATGIQARHSRIAQTFGIGQLPWNEELVLERYELLYEAGLIAEAVRDGLTGDAVIPSTAMTLDHRRILATGIGRLRSKIKYRPVVFELMPPAFTLLQLQLLVEALSGKRLHKQNFRRLVEKTGLVETTGQITSRTGGRPAQQFRFRPEVVAERQAPGVKLPGLRQAPLA